MPLLTTRYGAQVDAGFYQQAMSQRRANGPIQSMTPKINANNQLLMSRIRDQEQQHPLGLDDGAAGNKMMADWQLRAKFTNPDASSFDDSGYQQALNKQNHPDWFAGDTYLGQNYGSALANINSLSADQAIAVLNQHRPQTNGMAGLPDLSGYLSQLYPQSQGGGSSIQQNPSAQPGVGIAAPGASPNTANNGAAMPIGNNTGGSNGYNIDGRLDFGASGANFDFSGNPAALSQNYANSYMDALTLNAQNYGNIMGGYNQTMNNQLAAQDQLNQNYTGLGNQVQGMIAGTDQAQMQRINDNYNASMGQMNQGAVNRGLGNTTVTNALARGIESDRAQEQTNVQNQFAQLQAGYASNIGLAGLNQQGNNIIANTGLAGRQLNFMEGVSAPYPNPALYAQLGQQLGQGQQGAANRQQVQDQIAQLGRAGQQGSGQTGLNAGGGGGVRQSAFGPSSGNSSTTPGYGPGIGSGGGISSGGSGVDPFQALMDRRGQLAAAGGGGRTTTTGYPGAGSGGQAGLPGGASSPWYQAGGYPGPGNPQPEADYGNAGGGYDLGTGYTYDDLYGTDLGFDNSNNWSWDDLYGSQVTDPNADYYGDPNYNYDSMYQDQSGGDTNSYYWGDDGSMYYGDAGGYDWSGYYGDTGGGYVDPGYTDYGYSLNDLYGSDVSGGGDSYYWGDDGSMYYDG